ncbi:hypothetical protein [Azospirillum thiophilum]|nr:hypothetical protein [Azospirillum thiophilum]
MSDETRHPWVRDFMERPGRTLAKLLGGATIVPPYWRGEPDDVLVMVSGEIDGDPAYRDALDVAMLAWLDARRSVSATDRVNYGIVRFVGETVAALRAVRRLELRGTIADLNARDAVWRNWAEPLRLGESHDPLAELLSILALRQPADQPRLYRWHQLIDKAKSGLLPDYYIDIALCGLRNLPGRERPPQELLYGLARWATGLPDETDKRDLFMRRWHLEKEVLFPRSADTWRRLVSPLLEDRSFARTPAARWWREDLGMRSAKCAASRIEESAFPHLPAREEANRMLDRLNAKPLSQVMPDALQMLEAQRLHMERTGFAEPFLRMAGAIGNAALRSDPIPLSVRELTLNLAMHMVHWGPNNSYGWSLWGRVLIRSGQATTAEMVLWEARRRFPEVAAIRNILAGLIGADPARVQEAEAIFVETVARFPRDKIARNALAQLLVGQPGRGREAEAMFRKTMADFPNNFVAYNALGYLLMRFIDRRLDAKKIFEEVLEKNRNDGVAKKGLYYVSRLIDGDDGQSIPEFPLPSSEHQDWYAAQVYASELSDVSEKVSLAVDDGLCSRADFRLGAALDILEEESRSSLRERAWADIDAVLSRTPSHPLALLVGDLHGRSVPVKLEEAFAGAYGLKLLAAFRHKDAEKLNALVREVPARRPLVLLARLAGDVSTNKDAVALAKFLSIRKAPSDPPLATIHAYLRRQWEFENDTQVEPDDIRRRAGVDRDKLRDLVTVVCRQTAQETALLT